MGMVCRPCLCHACGGFCVLVRNYPCVSYIVTAWSKMEDHWASVRMDTGCSSGGAGKNGSLRVGR